MLLLRVLVRHRFGADIAYQLWLILPLAMIASTLPAPTVTPEIILMGRSALPGAAAAWDQEAAFNFEPLLCAGWLLGSCISLLWLLRSHHRLVAALNIVSATGDLSRSSRTDLGPMAMGFRKPTIVLPADFEARFNAEERDLILAHERLHIRRGDLHINSAASLLVCLFWFQPLVWLAWRLFRFDQELACDVAVLSQMPGKRAAYAHAMVRAQHELVNSALNCSWANTHPLQRRLEMIKMFAPSRYRKYGGRFLSVMIGGVFSYSLWAGQAPVVENAFTLPVSVPAEVVLDSVTLNESTIRIEGSATKLSSIAAFLKSLEAANEISNADLVETRNLKRNGSNVFAFVIAARKVETASADAREPVTLPISLPVEIASDSIAVTLEGSTYRIAGSSEKQVAIAQLIERLNAATELSDVDLVTMHKVQRNGTTAIEFVITARKVESISG